jgi:Sulfotransferase family
MFIGTNLNPYEDALELGLYSDRWIDRYVAADAQVDAETADAMLADLQQVVDEHLADVPGDMACWGWKEPRSIYLLPFFDSAMPGFRFVHFVRDGRDMAFSDNQNQLIKHGRAVLGEDVRRKSPEQSIALWNAVNLRAADYGETSMGERYLRVRFEDLCSDPAGTARAVYGFLDLRGDPGDAASEQVSPPATLGRWRDEKPATIRALEEAAGPALTRFGYL